MRVHLRHRNRIRRQALGRNGNHGILVIRTHMCHAAHEQIQIAQAEALVYTVIDQRSRGNGDQFAGRIGIFQIGRTGRQ